MQTLNKIITIGRTFKRIAAEIKTPLRKAGEDWGRK
jgi:hypothetical protein